MTITARPGAGDRRAMAVIEVKDSGRGLSRGDAERIFDRFQKAPDSTGSGLGLTIARAIIEAHHGRLTAHSAGPGQGACFTITLPAYSPGSPGEGRSGGPHEGAPVNTKSSQ